MVVCELLHVFYYYLLHVGTFSFLCIVCTYCKNIVFCVLGTSLMNQNKFILEVTNAVITRILCMLAHCVMHQNEFSFKVLYAVIARILFST